MVRFWLRYRRASRRVLPACVIAAGVLGTVVSAAMVPLRYQHKVGDVDGDGRPDPIIWRQPSSGFVTSPTFFTLLSTTNYTSSVARVLGQAGDIPVNADYDNDGKVDIAVYRPFYVNSWSILLSSQNYTATATYQWGLDDIPVPGDYDGDRKTDIAVFRASDGGWYILQNGTNFTSAFVVRWGDSASTPVPGDYDGDGRLDIATYASNTWFILQGASGFRTAFSVPFGGASTAIPVPGDYDGDGSTDPALYDPGTSTFSVLLRAGGYVNSFSKQWGVPNDIPTPGDFDGDGRLDMCTFRPANGTYYCLSGASNFTAGFTRQMAGVGGDAGDVPVMSQ